MDPNPFPASAVARLSGYGPDQITIPTAAVRQALSYVEEYLRSSSQREVSDQTTTVSGNIIAIVGEYGTGKTHVATQIIRCVESAEHGAVHAMYLDAPADTFLALYRQRFVASLSRQDVRQRVSDYYSDVVASSLADSELTSGVARRLESRELAPRDVVRDLGLMESEFLQELQRNLRSVTEKEDFGTALALFLRPEFEAAVWEWLIGNPPDDALRERGVTRTIDSDVDALEAIGVFAFLYGRQNHRFVLVIDELEKVLSSSQARHPGESSILAFKKLLEVFGNAQALLVLSGLPDFLEALPEDAAQRIGCIVRPSPLDPSDVAEYIEMIQERASGTRSLSPFTTGVVSYLTELAGGNARKVIRLCYHAVQSAKAANSEVTTAMVREAAREQFELTSRDDVRAETARICDANGWQFIQDHSLDPSIPSVDFWLPVGDDGNGVALTVSSSILYQREVEELQQRVQASVGGASQTRTLLLIVNGHIADNLSNAVHSLFSRVLVHSFRRYAEDLTAAIKGALLRLEDINQKSVLDAIRERVEQISRQNSSTRRVIEELTAAQYESRAVAGQSVEQAVRRVFSSFGSGSPTDFDPHYPSVSAVFSDAAMEIGRYRSYIDESIRLGFIVERRGLRTTKLGGIGIDFLRDSESSRGVGVVFFLERLIFEFRDACFRALRSRSRDEVSRDYLIDLCRSYSIVSRGLDESDVLGYLDHRYAAVESGRSNGLRNLLRLDHRVMESLEFDLDRRPSV
ncbi:Cdc6-like AAA superfamily ATPase [Catenulispora sp. MAP5-51]|uniref:hypothetical protein n=1 Tax=Catenulispora sp. MAP5-51 TaxID=3156298 RepID=UPI003511055B